MKKYGIEKKKYKKGDWPRTEGRNEHEIFKEVTWEITDILRKIFFQFVGEKKDILMEGPGLTNLSWNTMPYDHFGRCYGLDLNETFNGLRALTVYSKINTLLWMHHPGQILNPDVKSKFEIYNYNKCLFITLTYGYFKTSYNCLEYDIDRGFDYCSLKEAEKKLLKIFGCVLPISNSTENICMNNKQSIEAFKIHEATIERFSSTCPIPCSSMHVEFGFPSYSDCERREGEGFAKIYFKQTTEIVQVREGYSFFK